VPRALVFDAGYNPSRAAAITTSEEHRLADMPRGEPREHHQRGARHNNVQVPDPHMIADRQRQIGGWDNR
jgi:hypothetical protein